jgi:hypothetical protein
MVRIPTGAQRRYMNVVRALANHVEPCAQRI